MRNRIIDIADQPARLRVEHRQLVVETGDKPARIPLEDIAVVVSSHPQVSYTQAVLAELLAEGGAFVACDRNRLPVGMLLPLAGHFAQTERIRRQPELPLPKRKRLWQQLIRAKITMQAALLRERNIDDAALLALAKSVRSGDASNIEAQASRKYWTALFGSDFRRDRDAGDHNRFLNYGYAVLRAAVARAICAAGLHPSVGLHHHNRYNAFCLADDLIEPYRACVDRAVAGLMDERTDAVEEFDRETRSSLLASLTQFVVIDGEIRSLFDAVARTAQSLAAIVIGERDSLELPERLADAPQ